MPVTTPWSIFFPDGSSPANLITLLTSIATSVRDALTENLRQSKTLTVSRVANLTERNALFPSPVVGDKVYRTDTKMVERHDGSTWRNWESDWTAYTATLSVSIGTANWLGTAGTRVTEYKFSAGRCFVRGKFNFGTPPTFTGALFTLPFPSEQFQVVNQLLQGQTTLSDPGNAIYSGWVRYVTAAVVGILGQQSSGAAANVANNNPQVWAAGDFFYVDFVYDPA